MPTMSPSHTPSHSPRLSRSKSQSQPSSTRASNAKSRNSNNKKEDDSSHKIPYLFLGSIAAASLLAHKFWPRGVLHGEKEPWELPDYHHHTRQATTSKQRREQQEYKTATAAASAGRADRPGPHDVVSGSYDDDDYDLRYLRGRRRLHPGPDEEEEEVYRSRDRERDENGWEPSRYYSPPDRRGRPPLAAAAARLGTIATPTPAPPAAAAAAAAASHGPAEGPRPQQLTAVTRSSTTPIATTTSPRSRSRLGSLDISRSGVLPMKPVLLSGPDPHHHHRLPPLPRRGTTTSTSEARQRRYRGGEDHHITKQIPREGFERLSTCTGRMRRRLRGRGRGQGGLRLMLGVLVSGRGCSRSRVIAGITDDELKG